MHANLPLRDRERLDQQLRGLAHVTHSSGMSSGSGTSTARPFTVNVVTGAWPRWLAVHPC